MSAVKCPFCSPSDAGPRNTCVCPMCQEEEKTKIKAADKAFLHKKSTETVAGRKLHLYGTSSNTDAAIPWPHLNSTKLPHVPIACGVVPGRSTNAATPFSQLRDFDQRDISELMYPDGSYIMLNGQLRRINRPAVSSAPLTSTRTGFTPDSEVYSPQSKPESKHTSPISHKNDLDAKHSKGHSRDAYRDHRSGKRHYDNRSNRSRNSRPHRRLSDTESMSSSSDDDDDYSVSSASWSGSDAHTDDADDSDSSRNVSPRACQHCRRKEEARRQRSERKSSPKGQDLEDSSDLSHSDCRCSCHRGKQNRHQRHGHGKRPRGTERGRNRHTNRERKHVQKKPSRSDRPQHPSLTVSQGGAVTAPSPPKSNHSSPVQLPPLPGKEFPPRAAAPDGLPPNRDGHIPGYIDPVTGLFYYYYTPCGAPGQNGVFPSLVPNGNNGDNYNNANNNNAQFGENPFGGDAIPPGYEKAYPLPRYAPVNQSQQPFVPLNGGQFGPRDNFETSGNNSGSDRRHRAVPHAAYMVLIGPDGTPIAVPTGEDIGKVLMGKNGKGKPESADEADSLSHAKNRAGAVRNGRKQGTTGKPNKASQTGENLRRLSNEELLSQLEQMEGCEDGDELVKRVMDELRQRLFGEGPSSSSTHDPTQASKTRQTLRDRLNKAVGTSDEIEAELERQRRAKEEADAQKREEARRRAVEAEEQARHEAALEAARQKALEEAAQKAAEERRLADEALARQRKQAEEAEAEARRRAEQERLEAEAELAAREQKEREEAEEQRRRQQQEDEERAARQKAAADAAAAAAKKEEAERQRRQKEAEEAAREEEARQRRLKEEEEARRAREAAAEEAERQYIEQLHLEEERRQLLQLIEREAQLRDALEDREESDLVLILEQQQVEMDDVLEAEEAELRRQALETLVTDEETSRDTIDHQMRKSIVTILEIFDTEMDILREQEQQRADEEAAEKRRQQKAKQAAETSRSRLIPNQLKSQTEDGRIQYVGDPYINIIEERMRERRRQEKQRQNKLQSQLDRQTARQSAAASQATSHDDAHGNPSRSSISPSRSAARSPSVGPTESGAAAKRPSGVYGSAVRQPRSRSDVGSRASIGGGGVVPASRGSAVAQRPRLGSVSQFQNPSELDLMVQGHNVATPSKTRSRASSLASNRGADLAAGGRVFSSANTPRSQRGSVAAGDADMSSPGPTPRDGFQWP